MGVQAALTGHLVFSTLHTNNAATCLPRLLDMDIEPFLIASTVKAIVGQRLVRRLCNHCRKQHAPDSDEAKVVNDLVAERGENAIKQLHELEKEAKAASIGGDSPLSTSKSGVTNIWSAHPEGCDECSHTGFKGRVGIYEVLDVSIAVQKLITANSTSNDIQVEAIKEGMITMQLDGLIKALRGITTVEEVLRVTREQ